MRVARAAFLVLAVANVDSQPAAQELATRIDEYMAPYVEGKNFSGTIGVAQNGEILASQAYGMADPGRGTPNSFSTRHHLASLSKSITAAAVMLLVEEGLISVDDPLHRFIPEFPQGDTITIRHLLTHTSGIPDINRFPEYRTISVEPQTPATLLPVIASHSTEAAPTADYRYSNSNYNLLAHVIETASEKSYGDFVAERIFAPLGMTQTAHAGHGDLPQPAVGQIPRGAAAVEEAPYLDWSVKVGNGSIASTASDLLTFHRIFEGGVLLTEASLSEMASPQVGGNTGYGWFIRKIGGRDVVYYNGNTPGVSAYMSFDRTEQLSVVVLANHDIPLATQIGRAVEAMVLGREHEPSRAIQPVDFDVASQGAGYAGTFSFPSHALDIAVQGDELAATMYWPSYPMTLVPVGEDRFFVRFYWDELVFERGDDGAIGGLHWASSPGTRAVRRDPGPNPTRTPR